MRHRVALVVIAAALVNAAPAHADDAPAKLTVGDRARPLNVEGAPRFGWMPPSAVQTAYEIKVSRDGADVWDSGKDASSNQSYVAYSGPALQNGASYDWTVRTWDGAGAPSPYASAAHFDTGLTDSGWSGAQWIRRVTAWSSRRSRSGRGRSATTRSRSPSSRRSGPTSRCGQGRTARR